MREEFGFQKRMYGVFLATNLPREPLALFHFQDDAESFAAKCYLQMTVRTVDVDGKAANDLAAAVGGAPKSDCLPPGVDWPEEMRTRDRLKFDQQFDGEI